MKKFLRLLGWVLGSIVVVAVMRYALAFWVTHSRYNHKCTAHDATFPMPFPLTDAEVKALSEERVAAGAAAGDPLAGTDLQAVALERAIARGKQLIGSRVGCAVCHRPDFGGGAVVDEPMFGRWIAPNVTMGKGSVTTEYTASGRDHAVRHGLRHDDRTSTMPSVDFVNLSDRELSDIVACIRSMPPVDRDPGKVVLGPVFIILLALDKSPLLAFSVDHMKPHAAEPPAAAGNVEFGGHLAQVCRGCHGPHGLDRGGFHPRPADRQAPGRARTPAVHALAGLHPHERHGSPGDLGLPADAAAGRVRQALSAGQPFAALRMSRSRSTARQRYHAAVVRYGAQRSP